jgi:hypothetical protein
MSNSGIFPQTYFTPDTVDDDYVDDDSNPLRRVYAQYRNKTKLVAWIQICTLLGADLYQVAQIIRKSYDVDNVNNEMLNVIGRVVVLPRSFLSPADLNPPMVASSENNPWEVGDTSEQLSGLTTDSDSSMSDEFYRLGVRAKIVKNNTSATIDDILAGASFLLPNAKIVRLVDDEDMSFTIEYTGNITELESYALANSSLVSTPQGVKFNGFVKVES